jgi:hypothetical protein
MPCVAQQYKFETPIAPRVAVPDKVATSIGTLNLSYGYPDAATIEKVYDNLDRSRALQAYLLGIPLAQHIQKCTQIGSWPRTHGIDTNQCMCSVTLKAQHGKFDAVQSSRVASRRNGE